MTQKRHLLMIFVKFPEPGKVKTRLAKSVGDEAAAEIYRKLVARVAEQVAPGGEPAQRWELRILFDPPDRSAEVREWLEPLFVGTAVEYIPQVTGDLGDRLAAGFAEGFAGGFAKVAAIGTDCVELTGEMLRACWQLLDSNDVVFGPADDGGYYLIGMTKLYSDLFSKIPWSTGQTLAASKAAAKRGGLRCVDMDTLSDIDELGQWQALRRSDRRWEEA